MTSRTAAAVLTVSDGVAAGTREDRSGSALSDRLAAAGFTVVAREVVPDEQDEIVPALRRLARESALVVTTGGTGFAERDVTPEATATVIERPAPGLAEAMRAAGRRSTPYADLSRGVAGIVADTIVVNLPGSTSGALESLDAVLPVLGHALDLLAGDTRHGHADDQADDRAGGEVDASSAAPPASAGHAHGHRRDHALRRDHAHDDARTRGDEPAPDRRADATGDDVLAELLRRRASGADLVLATAVRTQGDPPCEPGQKLLLERGGPVAGTLGCAEFDSAAADDVADVLADNAPALRTYEHDLGSVQVQLEPHVRRPVLAAVGATPVARYLLRWGRDLGFEPVLVEGRDERVTPELLDEAARRVGSVAELSITDDAAVVHTDHDAPAVTDDLESALSQGAGFVGLMGSRRHASAPVAALRDRLGDAAAERVHTPVGLDIGSRTPAEIALSILSAAVASLRDADGGWLHR